MNKRLFQVLIFALVIFDVVVFYAMLRESHGDMLTVSFFDVGQGDAIFIQVPNGNQMIVDGGPDNSLLRRLGEVMPFYDRTIDAIVVTNPDKDHFAGFIPMLDRYRVGNVIEPGTSNASGAYVALEQRVREKGISKYLLKTGDRLILDRKRGIVFDVLFPDRDISGLASNDGSLVMRLSYGSICFLLMGDSTRGVEEYLVHLYGSRLKCQVLKTGHHGSRTSTSPIFVDDVKPQYAVISDGKDNTYGHPHQETLDTLNNAGVHILRTDILGTVTLKTDGVDILQK